MADGSIIIDTKLDASGVEQGLARLTSIAAKGAAAVTSAIGGASVAAIKVGSDFESAMSQVASISGATGDELASLTQKAEEMGAKTKFSATESAQALQYMAMAGWKTEDMLGGISGVMDLAAASGEDLASVSDIVTDAMTAFGLSASQSGRFADVLAAASSNANTNVGLMGATFKYVAPVAGAMGFSIEDTAAAIGLMANAGIKGEQAGTALRAVLSRLVDPPKDAADAMQSLGIAVANSDGSMRGLGDIVGQLRDRLGGLSEVQQSSAASALAGQEAMSGLLAIVNASDADFEKLTSAIADSSGAAKQMADTMQDNLKGQITILGSSLEGLGIKVYRKFAEPMKKGVGSATDAVNQLTRSVENGRLSGSVDKIAQSFGRLSSGLASGAVKVLPGVLDGFAWVLDHGRQITAVLGGVAAGMIAFKTASVMTPVIAGWQAATLSLHLYAMGAGAAALSQAALNGTLTASEILVGALTGKIGLVTAAQALWNTVVMAHPLGALCVAIGVAVAAIALFCSREDEAAAAMKETQEQIHEQAQAWKELDRSKEEDIQSSVAEVEHVQALWREFKTLVGENGKVIKSKERARQISEEINKLAPDSIRWLDEETIAYKENAGAIDQLIKKKKAQAILDAMRPAYEEAVASMQQAQIENAKLVQQIAETQQKMDELGAKAGGAASGQYRHYVLQMEELQASLAESESTLTGYYATVQEYEEGTAVLLSDNSRDWERWAQDHGRNMKTANNATREELAEQARLFETNLQTLEGQLRDGVEGVTEQMVSGARGQFYKACEELNTAAANAAAASGQGFTQGIETSRAGVVGSVDRLTGDAAAHMREGGAAAMGAAAGGVSENAGVLQQAHCDAVGEALDAGQNVAVREAPQIGRAVDEGAARGVQRNSSFLSAVKNMASKALSAVKNFFGIHSPATRWRDEVGKPSALGVGVGFEEAMPGVTRRMRTAVQSQIASLGKGVGIAADVRLGGAGAANAPATAAAYSFRFEKGSVVLDPKNIRDLEGFAELLLREQNRRQDLQMGVSMRRIY